MGGGEQVGGGCVGGQVTGVGQVGDVVFSTGQVVVVGGQTVSSINNTLAKNEIKVCNITCMYFQLTCNLNSS